MPNPNLMRSSWDRWVVIVLAEGARSPRRKVHGYEGRFTEAPQETEVTTPLAASLGAETFITPPVEIASTMGASREATDGIDKVPQ